MTRFNHYRAIKPCAFCGAKITGTSTKVTVEMQNGDGVAFVECSRCRARGPTVNIHDEARRAAIREHRRRRPARGFACLRMLLVTAACMAGAIIGSAALGHLLMERDRAHDEAAYAEEREAKCERGWHVTLTRAQDLREQVAEHLAIESEGPCVCEVAP